MKQKPFNFVEGFSDLVETVQQGLLDIFISLEVSDSKLHFQIENDIHEADSRQGGIGVQNVQKRLQLIYPNRHRLSIRKEKDKFEVTLDILLSGVH